MCVKMGKYDRPSLIEFCDNNAVVLDVIPDKCNRETRVSGQCLIENCDGHFEKSIRRLLDEGGPHCKNCSTKNGHLKRVLKMDYRFNKKHITKFCEKNGVVLDVIPDNCNRNTRVNGQCLTENCDGRFEKSIGGLLDISGPYCDICTAENTNRKKEETNMKIRGVSNPSQSEEVKQKKEETSMKNWGVSNPSQSEVVKQKAQETSMKNWGVSYTMQSEVVKQKAQETSIKNWGVSHPLKSKELRAAAFETNMSKYNTPYPTQNQDVKQKTQETNIRKLGVSYPMQNEHVRKKSKQTCIDKYGKPFPTQSEEVKQKTRETNVEKWGVKCTLQSEEVIKKIEETCLQKYGVRKPLQNPEILERHQKARFKRKLYITPSGKEWYLQGYEPLVAQKIIEEYGEENITPDIKIVPRIPWFDEDGKEHYYFCDFYIDSHKLIIEVKSEWTAELNADKIQRTRKASNELGYDFRLIVLNKDGEWVEDTITSNQRQSCSTSSPS
jgi:hypothetical protein